MKKLNRYLLRYIVLSVLLSVLFLTNEKASGQDFDLRLMAPPPGKLGLVDLWKVTINNRSRTETYSVYFYGTLTEKKAGIIATATTVEIDIKPGVKNLKASDFPKQPDVSYPNPDNKYKESLIKTGNVPPGEYTYCVYVRLKKNNQEMGHDCLDQTIEETGLLSLTLPNNEDEIPPNTPVVFSWMSSNPKPGAKYTLRIVEILNGQTPETAMERNNAFFVKENLTSTTFNYPTSAPKFRKDGKQYAWGILGGSKLISEVWSFNVTDALQSGSATISFVPTVDCCYKLYVWQGINSNYSSCKFMSSNISSVTAESGYSIINSNIPTDFVLKTNNFSAFPKGVNSFVGTVCFNSSSNSIPITVEWSTNNGIEWKDPFDSTLTCSTQIDDCPTIYKNIYKNWYFGKNAALKFDPNPTVISNSNINTEEGCASISDNNGNLLFYTDGQSLWNSTSNTPVVTDLMGQKSSTQSSLIVQAPLNPNKYYIFTTGEWGHHSIYCSPTDEFCMNNPKLFYREVTTNGSIVTPSANNVLLHSENISEKLTAVRHSNGTDIWVIAHEAFSDKFLFFLVSSSGVSLIRTQEIGLFYTEPTGLAISLYVPGQMKISPDCQTLAMAIYGDLNSGRNVEIYGFNNNSGVLTAKGSKDYPVGSNPYGIEFSSDSKLLYVGLQGWSKQLIQYNLSDLTETYSYSTTDNTSFMSLQMGPNGRIYISRRINNDWQNKLAAINNPDVIGSGCNFVLDAVNLGSGKCMNGLPNNWYICCQTSLPPSECHCDDVPEVNIKVGTGNSQVVNCNTGIPINNYTLGTPVNFEFGYICSPYTETATYSWEIKERTMGSTYNTIQSGTAQNFNYPFSSYNQYLLDFRIFCCGNECYHCVDTLYIYESCNCPSPMEWSNPNVLMTYTDAITGLQVGPVSGYNQNMLEQTTLKMNFSPAYVCNNGSNCATYSWYIDLPSGQTPNVSNPQVMSVPGEFQLVLPDVSEITYYRIVVNAICGGVICDTIARGFNVVPGCGCEKWDDTPHITVNKNNQTSNQYKCNGTHLLDNKSNSITSITASGFNCKPNNANCQPFYKWEIRKNNGDLLYNGDGSEINYNNLSGNQLPNSYQVFFYPWCGGIKCEPCILNVKPKRSLEYGNTVTIRLHQPPPNQLRVEDLYKVILNYTLETPINVYLFGSIVSKTDGPIIDATTAIFSLRQGERKMVLADEVGPIDVNERNQKICKIIEKIGGLPTGEYEICVYVKDAITNEILASDCIMHKVKN